VKNRERERALGRRDVGKRCRKKVFPNARTEENHSNRGAARYPRGVVPRAFGRALARAPRGNRVSVRVPVSGEPKTRPLLHEKMQHKKPSV
jgi:hypothetical protein